VLFKRPDRPVDGCPFPPGSLAYRPGFLEDGGFLSAGFETCGSGLHGTDGISCRDQRNPGGERVGRRHFVGRSPPPGPFWPLPSPRVRLGAPRVSDSTAIDATPEPAGASATCAARPGFEVQQGRRCDG